MVSFWPFKADDDSAETFEKILSQLSASITRATARHDRFRQKQRRYKALYSLYTTFAWILVSAILLLVTGRQTWSAAEWTAVAGGPVVIFAGRYGLDAWYNYWATRTQNHINDLNKQRDEAIERLKKATKYNSTQQLLDKYGGSPAPSPRRGGQQQSPQNKAKRKSDIGPQTNASPQAGRTGLPPPPTANVPRRGTGLNPPPTANIPRHGTPPVADAPRESGPPPFNIQQPRPDQSGPIEEFAPNAFDFPSAMPPPPSMRQPSSTFTVDGPKWYDRILDVVLGEDETSAKNRIALVCQSCKLVNGQAPPGARTLEDVGRWRCSACHAWNGVESEEKQILQQISQGAMSPGLPEPISAVSDPGPQMNGVKDEDEEDDAEEEESDDTAPLAASTRSKAGRGVKRV